jgi:beta-phosphoglucomutase-like phosphatase (HAD superfamily)
MLPIETILFELVGCLAEYEPEPFQEIAALLFGRRRQPSKSGSRSYWHLLNLMEAAGETCMIEALEMEAVAGASLYEDVLPALSELRSLGVKLLIASSLSAAVTTCFLKAHGLMDFFAEIRTRDNSGGIKAAPLKSALAAIRPERAIYLSDTAEGLKTAESAGVNAVLMMNDPDEARRLALRNPAGGIVSLHELPDFVRIVAAQLVSGSLQNGARGRLLN